MAGKNSRGPPSRRSPAARNGRRSSAVKSQQAHTSRILGKALALGGRGASGRGGEASDSSAEEDAALVGAGDRGFEVEDDLPEELKARNRRYDDVEVYEYELPDDFEDEEIDEDLAFGDGEEEEEGDIEQQGPGARKISLDEEEEEEEEEDEEEDEEKDEEEDDEEEEEKEGAEEDGEEEEAGAHARVSNGHAGLDSDGDGGGEEEEDGEGEGEQVMEEEEGEEDGEEEQEDDEDEDEEEEGLSEDEAEGDKHNQLIAALTQRESVNRDQQKGKLRAVAPMSEGFPESEFNAPPAILARGATDLAALSVDDLLAPMAGVPGLSAVRKQLQQVDRLGGPQAAPLPAVIQQRVDRKVAYEQTKEDVGKWQALVKRNREAPVLDLRPQNRVPGLSTAALAAKFEPSTEMEREVAEALGAAAGDEHQLEQEELALNKLTVEEVRERQNRLARMRSLMLRSEVKAKRVRKIKSKTYHRILKKAEQRKLQKEAGAEGAEDKEAARAAAIKQEFKRAQERMTLRHKNSSKWAKRIIKRGLAGKASAHLEGTREAIQEQLRRHQELRLKAHGPEGTGEDGGEEEEEEEEEEEDSEGEESGEESGEEGSGDEEEDEEERQARKASKKALGVLRRSKEKLQKEMGWNEEGEGEEEDGGEEEGAVKKGLFALPFMSRALERKKREAEEEARSLLMHLESEEAKAREWRHAGEGGEEAEERGGEDAKRGKGRMSFGGQQGQTGKGAVAGAEEEGEEGVQKGVDGAWVEDSEGEEEERARLQAEEGGLLQSSRGAGVPSEGARKGRKGAPQGGLGARQEEEDVAGSSDRLEILGPIGVPTASSAEELASESGATRLIAMSEGAGEGQRQGVLSAGDGEEGQGRRGKGKKGKGQGSRHKGSADAEALGPVLGTIDPAEMLVHNREREAGSRLLAPDAERSGDGDEEGIRKGGAAAHEGRHEQEGGDALPALLPDWDAVDNASPSEADGVDGLSRGGESEEHHPQGGGVGGISASSSSLLASQEELIRQAFAGDDVAAEFEEEKQRVLDEEVKREEGPVTLPGWGQWAGVQRKKGPPQWLLREREAAEKKREAAVSKRADAKLKTVIISEKMDKKAAKFQVASVPFPFKSREDYERSIRAPVGREFNTEESFREIIQPEVLKVSGAIIEPIKYVKSANQTKEPSQDTQVKKQKRKAPSGGGTPMVGSGKRRI